jgi:hypothetical protein
MRIPPKELPGRKIFRKRIIAPQYRVATMQTRAHPKVAKPLRGSRAPSRPAKKKGPLSVGERALMQY